MNASGDVAFAAQDDAGLDAMVVGRNSLAPVVREGDPAPGATPAATFTRFSSPGITSHGDVSFLGQTSGPIGLWAPDTAGLKLVAGGGNPAPGTEPDTFFLGLPSSFPTNSHGRLALNATLTGPSVSGLNNRGVWGPTSSADFDLLARSADQAPGTPVGTNYSAFGSVAMNDASRVVFSGSLTGPGVTTLNNEGIFVTDATGAVNLVAREGEIAPGTSSPLYALSDLAIDGLNRVSVIASLYLAPADEGKGIWRTGPSGLELVARAGDPAPGADPGQAFFSFADIFANGAGLLAFEGSLRGAGVSDANDNGIWRENASGGFDLIAREGDPVPDLLGVSFDQFRVEMGLSDGGGFLFESSLAGDEVDDSNYRGVFLATADGELVTLFRAGDVIEVAPGDFRTLRTWSIETGLNGTRRSGLSPDDEFAFLGYFLDGSSGVFVASVPEPSVLLLLMGAPILALRATQRR
jgi:hypothetical protein